MALREWRKFASAAEETGSAIFRPLLLLIGIAAVVIRLFGLCCISASPGERALTTIHRQRAPCSPAMRR